MLIERFRTNLTELCGVGMGSHVVVALSGGADSMVLLSLFKTIQEAYQLKLTAVHIHHGLREASDEEAVMVTTFCEQLGIPCFVHRVDVMKEVTHHKSIEEAARDVRYAQFNNYLKDNTVVALGHHKNDQAETILFNVIRGTGLKGLQGMRFRRDAYIRPLLDISKEEIIQYCQEQHISYCVDESNLDVKYTRNRLRQELIPYIEEHFNPSVIESLSRLGQIASEEEAFLNELTMDRLHTITLSQVDGVIRFDLAKFQHQDQVIQKRLIRALYNNVMGHVHNLTNEQVLQTLHLLMEGKTGKTIGLAGGLWFLIDYHQVVVSKDINKPSPPSLHEEIDLRNFQTEESGVIGSLKIRRLKAEKGLLIPQKPYTKWFDYDKIGDNLVLRTREIGDFIQLDMDGHTQSIKKYYINHKISKSLRDRTPLLTKAAEVIWIIGHRVNPNYQITSSTNEILEVCYLKEEEDER